MKNILKKMLIAYVRSKTKNVNFGAIVDIENSEDYPAVSSAAKSFYDLADLTKIEGMSYFYSFCRRFEDEIAKDEVQESVAETDVVVNLKQELKKSYDLNLYQKDRCLGILNTISDELNSIEDAVNSSIFCKGVLKKISELSAFVWDEIK